METDTPSNVPRVAVVGGGLAGMAAALALADHPVRVTLLERRDRLGGRAASFVDPRTGEEIDHCQHVLLGCCTELIDFYRKTGALDLIRFTEEIVFLHGEGRRSVLSPGVLPAPFHFAESFLGLSFLSMREKLAVGRGMMRLLRGKDPEDLTFAQWLVRAGQPERAVRRFWEPVIVSALNEVPRTASLKYARQVFVEGFLRSREGARMGIPSVPLGRIYDEKVLPALRAKGVEVRFPTAVRGVHIENQTAIGLHLGKGDKYIFENPSKMNSSPFPQPFDRIVCAVPHDRLLLLLPEELRRSPRWKPLERLEVSPITGVHLRFEKKIPEIGAAAVLDRTIQWIFQKPVPSGTSLQLVVSASRDWLKKGRGDILNEALRELGELIPELRGVAPEHARVVKDPKATISPSPESEYLRPAPGKTSVDRLFLAGDWTATGWPGTMEGAVRSGRTAAEEVLKSL